MAHDDTQRVYKLLSVQADDRLSEEEWAELVLLMSSSKQARKAYIDYMFLQAAIHRRIRLAPQPVALPEQLDDDELALLLNGCSKQAGGKCEGTPILGFLANTFNNGVEFFSRSMVFSFLFAVVLPGLMCLTLVLYVSLQSANDQTTIAWCPPPSPPVASVSAVHQCIWSDTDTNVAAGDHLTPGRRLSLLKGLAEIHFNKGASVIIEGPVMFETISDNQGFLHIGSVVAQVPESAKGFSVQTPAITLVDYGTEFGACVEDGQGTAEVHVFQGKVGLSVGGEHGKDKTLKLLQAGRMVHIEPSALHATPIIRDIKPSSSRFVRHLPAPPVKPDKPTTQPEPAAVETAEETSKIVTDNFERDKVEEPSRPGWSNSWTISGRNFGAQYNLAIANGKPLGDAGKYLQFSAKPTAKAILLEDTVCRRFRSKPGFTPAEPYEISFDLRIDHLGNFNRATDMMAITGDVKASLKAAATTAWKIFIVGSDALDANQVTWKFLAGNIKTPRADIDSNIVAIEGNVYSFSILVDPIAKTWTPSIGVNGGKPTAFATMKLCSTWKAQDCDYWTALNFQWFMEDRENDKAVRGDCGFSLDSVRISQVENK